MAIARVSGGVLGYDVEQVDALMDRVRRQYENPQSRFVVPSMLSAVSFDLVPGGYRIDEVDRALAQVAEDFEKVDIQRRLDRIGKVAMRKELRSQVGLIAEVLAMDSDRRFSAARNGFGKKQVKQLLSEITVVDGVIKAPEPMDMRTRALGRSSMGPAKSEVNEFLSVVIGVIYRQQLLG